MKNQHERIFLYSSETKFANYNIVTDIVRSLTPNGDQIEVNPLHREEASYVPTGAEQVPIF